MAPELEFFFDVGSPYSYLAATQLPALADRTGATVRWRPFLLGGLFKETGNQSPVSVPQKGRYMLVDLKRWAETYGVAFNLPSAFPLNTLKAQRALTAQQRADPARVPDLALGLFRALWSDNLDVSSIEVLSRVVEQLGLDPDPLVRAVGPDAKDALRRVTDEAFSRGAFGAPTFFVGEDMFWGNDRLAQVEERLNAEGRDGG